VEPEKAGKESALGEQTSRANSHLIGPKKNRGVFQVKKRSVQEKIEVKKPRGRYYFYTPGSTGEKPGKTLG